MAACSSSGRRSGARTRTASACGSRSSASTGSRGRFRSTGTPGTGWRPRRGSAPSRRSSTATPSCTARTRSSRTSTSATRSRRTPAGTARRCAPSGRTGSSWRRSGLGWRATMSGGDMSQRPQGTVTFLFTDVEGSTRLVRALGRDYGDVLARHSELIRDAVASPSRARGGHAGGGLLRRVRPREGQRRGGRRRATGPRGRGVGRCRRGSGPDGDPHRRARDVAHRLLRDGRPSCRAHLRGRARRADPPLALDRGPRRRGREPGPRAPRPRRATSDPPRPLVRIHGRRRTPP